MVSKPIAVLVVAVIAVAAVLAYFGLAFQKVQEENLKMCVDAQQKIYSIAGDPTKTTVEKNNRIDRIIAQANDEMRKRQFECFSPFIVPEYKQTKPENKP